MNRKQRRSKQNKSIKNIARVTEKEIGNSLSGMMDLFGDSTSTEDAMNILKATGKFAVKGGAVTYRMVSVEDGFDEIEAILANGGTVEYPES